MAQLTSAIAVEDATVVDEKEQLLVECIAALVPIRGDTASRLPHHVICLYLGVSGRWCEQHPPPPP
eukprot:4454315-Pyramimonas_sp.AAC.1